MEFLHVKPGKGAAFVRSKLKNLISGTTMEKTFRAGESVEEAVVNKMDMQFSYDDGESYQFMNLETYETESVPKAAFSSNNQGNFLLEGMVVQVRSEGVIRTAGCFPLSLNMHEKSLVQLYLSSNLKLFTHDMLMSSK